MPPLELNVDLLQPHEKQQLFVDSTAKRIIVRAGRRGGKTTGVGIRAAKRFLQGRRILYAAPTADQLQAFWKEVCLSFAECTDNGVFRKNETEHVIEWPGKPARIRAKTAWNAETLRGDFADDLILDEFQLMNEDAWEIVGAPMLLDNNGDAVFIYTPPSLHSAGTSKARDLRHASKMFKRAVADKTGRWQAFHFTSHDNPHISSDAVNEITQDMTALAVRQEIMAEDVDEVPGALWTRALLEETRVAVAPPLSRIVVGVDPSGSSTTEAGIVAGGIGAEDGHLYILEDRSVAAASPRTWATAAVSLYEELHADRLVAERNYGGDMVEETIRAVSESISYKDVNATRGKVVRAEPIAARFEKHVAHLVGSFPRLEEELTSYVPGNPSPNRLDAMVWVGTELVYGGVLGLVGFYKQGMAQEMYDTLQQDAVTVRVREAAAPKKNGNGAAHCPECDSMTVQVIAGGQLRCQQCGVQWGASKTSVYLPGRKEMTAAGGLHVGRR